LESNQFCLPRFLISIIIELSKKGNTGPEGFMAQQKPVVIMEDQTARYADMLAALGTEPRLRIIRKLLSSHPEGMFPGELTAELEIPASTLSHHLDKLKNEDLVRVSREGTFLRYSANDSSLQELLSFLYAECCTRNKAVKPESVVQIRK
jgi:ArsR family transcriptional regulator, arsenate/arsenite/antimonite-responsive transcriptional repressor